MVVLFQHRDPGRWSAAVAIRLRTMIEGSLVTLFAALLPFVLHPLGWSGTSLWRTCSLVLALTTAAFGLRVWLRSRAAIGGGELSRAFSTAVSVLNAGVVAALVLGAADVGPARGFAPYFLGVTWNLVFASLMFLRLAAFPSP